MVLVQVFVGIRKVFDTVNRLALWSVLLKLGFPAHFVSLVRSFPDNMEACVNIQGILAEHFKEVNGIKQYILGLTIYFSVVLANAFKDCSH